MEIEKGRLTGNDMMLGIANKVAFNSMSLAKGWGGSGSSQNGKRSCSSLTSLSFSESLERLEWSSSTTADGEGKSDSESEWAGLIILKSALINSSSNAKSSKADVDTVDANFTPFPEVIERLQGPEPTSWVYGVCWDDDWVRRLVQVVIWWLGDLQTLTLFTRVFLRDSAAAISSSDFHLPWGPLDWRLGVWKCLLEVGLECWSWL